jgi:hypothetical protein
MGRFGGPYFYALMVRLTVRAGKRWGISKSRNRHIAAKSGTEPYREFRYGSVIHLPSHIQTRLLSSFLSFFFF